MNPDLRREPKSHWKFVGDKKVPKIKYETKKLALKAACKLNSMQHIIHKFVVYQCPTCGYWHIGRSYKELTERDMFKATKRLKYLS